MSLFSIMNYREVIKKQIHQNACSRGYRSRMAEAAGCQLSHLSQVLNGVVHLTPEQAAALCDFWEFSDLDTDYFLTLVNWERAGTVRLQKKLMRVLERMRRQDRLTGGSVQNTEDLLSLEQSRRYYSAWYWGGIRTALYLPGLRTAPSIAAHLSLPLSLVANVLKGLEEMNLIARDGDKWIPLAVCIALSNDHGLSVMDQTSWRQKAMQTLQMGEGRGNFHVNSYGAVSREDFVLIKTKLLEAVEKKAAIVERSPAEILYGFCMDFISF